jgi:hypothetical protein
MRQDIHKDEEVEIKHEDGPLVSVEKDRVKGVSVVCVKSRFMIIIYKCKVMHYALNYNYVPV